MIHHDAESAQPAHGAAATRFFRGYMNEIRTLIVDDELLGRKRLRKLLSHAPDVEILQECSSGADAIAVVREAKPDLVFLDVQMPGMSGFDVVAQLDPEDAPSIVFATAHDEFALRAFDANAFDYLLKPIGAERLNATLEKVRQRMRSGSGSVPAALPESVAAKPYRDRFAVRVGGRYLIVKSTQIVWLEADNNHVRIHTAAGSYPMRQTMGEMERSLDPQCFVRIHRSVIINVDQVRAIEPWGLGEYLFVLETGAQQASSRRYRKAIKHVFGC